jgi:hypothetical protein
MHRVTKQYLKRKWPGDHRMHELIDYIMPVIYYLHQEYLNNAGAEVGSEYDWKQNIVDLEVKMVAALGHGHEMHGDLSIILSAFGNITRAYKETIAGGYATDVPGNATAWDPDDRLFTIGKGVTPETRSDALTLYKNGFLELMNAVVIGAFSSDGMSPKDGAVQYITERLELYFDEEWHPIAFTSDIKPPATITLETENETTSEHHTHKLDLTCLVNQPGHGFSVKNAIRSTASGWVLAKADNAVNAQTGAVVVKVIDADNFRYQSEGFYNHPDFDNDKEYALSPTVAGEIIGMPGDEFVWEIGWVRQHLGFGTDRGLKIEIDVGDVIGSDTASIITEKHVVGTGKPDDKVRLYGDEAAPITSGKKYYGTKDGSDEGFHDLPSEAVQLLSGTSPTFDMEKGRGAIITLTGDTTITFANLQPNDTGHIDVIQDATGGHTLSLAGATIEIAENSVAAANQVLLTGVAGSKDVVAWWYTGSIIKIAVIFNMLTS